MTKKKWLYQKVCDSESMSHTFNIRKKILNHQNPSGSLPAFY